MRLVPLALIAANPNKSSGKVSSAKTTSEKPVAAALSTPKTVSPATVKN